ncbi:MAG: nitroreductase family protein [Bacteroidales bacterium]|nr:nitroreductase family protein [Bacteroidales bacterium]
MNPTLQTLTAHRSVRAYAAKEVSEETLQQVLRAASRASTTGNMQLYSIIVNRDAEMKRKIAPAHFNQPAVTSAPVVLTFCADFRRFNRWCRFREAEPGYDNLQSFMWAVVDAVAATQNACIAAESLGLGICYLGTVTYNAHELIKIYGLPEGVVPVTCITMGYPAEQPPLTDRLPMDGIVHREVYQDYDRERIDAVYAEREASAETLRLLKENDLPNLARIFTERRYKAEDNVAFSKLFMKVLEEQGFMNF